MRRIDGAVEVGCTRARRKANDIARVRRVDVFNLTVALDPLAGNVVLEMVGACFAQRHWWNTPEFNQFLFGRLSATGSLTHTWSASHAMVRYASLPFAHKTSLGPPTGGS